MPEIPAFPHLRLSAVGTFKPKFPRPGASAEVDSNKNNRPAHLRRLREAIGRFRDLASIERERRRAQNLPIVTAGGSFMMRIPEGVDPDAIASALGVELVAEADGGFLLATVEDLSLARIEEVLQRFENNDKGGGAAANLLEIFSSPGDPSRLSKILSGPVMELWPFGENQDYIFDASIQTAEGTRSYKIPVVRKRVGETDDALQQRRASQRLEALVKAEGSWAVQAEKRFGALKELIEFYRGELLTGIAADDAVKLRSATPTRNRFAVVAMFLTRSHRERGSR